MSKLRLTLALLFLISALSLAACGGGSGSADEAQITETIQTAATSTDPADCTKLETLAFVEQNSYESGEAAIRLCEKEIAEPGTSAESVDVSNVEVKGERATADAAFTGSTFDGQTLSVALFKEGGAWKLDRDLRFAKFDPAALAKAFESQLSDPSTEFSKAQIGCVVEGIEADSQAQVEELLFSGSPEAFVALVKGCS